jgi:hypothetical protein
VEEEIVTQLGLILSQLRFTRRAVEDIERSTARYGGLSFAQALAAGPKFGEPPMFAGALRVYVVNIDDLAPGSGIGGFLESLLGGVGRFFGGFFGGLAGGTIGGLALADVISDLAKLADAIDNILERLGIGKQKKEVPADAKKGEKVPPAAGMDLGDTLKALSDTLDKITPFFVAASQGPEKEKTKKLEPPDDAWTNMLKLAHTILTDIDRVVKGLILLIPLLIGALAWLVVKLDTLKAAFLELVQFILKNALLLRGVALAVIFDTLAQVAKLANDVLKILKDAVVAIVDSVFKILEAVISIALRAIEILAKAVSLVISALTDWLAGPLMEILSRIANSLLFRFLIHIMKVLPAILPPLYELVREKGDKDKGILESPPLGPDQLKKLEDAAAMAVPQPAVASAAAKAVTDLKFPDFATILTKNADIFALQKLFSDTSAQVMTIKTELANVFTTAQDAVTKLETALKNAAAEGEKKFNEKLTAHIKVAKDTATELAKVLDPAIAAAKKKKETGLEIIAQRYEEWVKGGGMKLVLDQVGKFFSEPPGKAAAEDIVSKGKIDAKVPVTVEIGDVTIEIVLPEKPGQVGTGAPTLGAVEKSLYPSPSKLQEDLHEWSERGGGDALAAGPWFAQFNTLG